MTVLVSAIMAIVVVEMILRLPIVFRARDMVRFTRKASRLVAAKHVSDTWKEKVLLRYSREILMNSLMVLFYLLLIAAVIGLADGVLRAALGIHLIPALVSPMGIIVATLTAFLYVALRKRVGHG